MREYDNKPLLRRPLWVAIDIAAAYDCVQRKKMFIKLRLRVRRMHAEAHSKLIPNKDFHSLHHNPWASHKLVRYFQKKRDKPTLTIPDRNSLQDVGCERDDAENSPIS